MIVLESVSKIRVDLYCKQLQIYGILKIEMFDIESALLPKSEVRKRINYIFIIIF